MSEPLLFHPLRGNRALTRGIVKVKLPSSLEHSPLLDAIFELRFVPTNAAAGDLLPGLLFQEFGSDYAEVTPLPMASVPRELREADANLRFQPSYRLRGGNRRIDVGQRVLDIGFGFPYPGWETTRTSVASVLGFLPKTKLIKAAERISFRYINVVPVPAVCTRQLEALEAKFEVLGNHAPEVGFRLRMEIPKGKCTTIIQIQTGATATVEGGRSREGILVDVDTLRMVKDEELWGSKERLLDEVHLVLKEAFFSLLTKETIESLGPKWGQNG